MNFKVFVANLLWRQLFGQCFRLGCRSVLVCAANIQCIVAGHTRVSSKNISRQNTTNNIAQMWNIINVWQGRSDQHILFPGYWQSEKKMNF